MKGRPSGKRKVAIKVGPAGQQDSQHGRAGTRASEPTQEAPSSTTLARFESMRVSDLQKLLQERGLSRIDHKEHLVERLGTAAAGEMEEVEEEQHSGAFRNSSPTRLDTAEFSMTAAEESTPGDSTTM